MLQRDAAAPPAVLWGFADAGVSVAVTMDGGALLPAATAGADGIWRQALPATPAGGPHEFLVNASDGSYAVDAATVRMSSAACSSTTAGSGFGGTGTGAGWVSGTDTVPSPSSDRSRCRVSHE